MLQHAATRCNTLQHTATYTWMRSVKCVVWSSAYHTYSTYCNTLQHATIQCNILQHTATHYNATMNETDLLTVERTESHHKNTLETWKKDTSCKQQELASVICFCHVLSCEKNEEFGVVLSRSCCLQLVSFFQVSNVFFCHVRKTKSLVWFYECFGVVPWACFGMVVWVCFGVVVWVYSEVVL